MLKIIVISLICAFIITYLKSTKNEFADLAIIASSVILIYLSISYIVNTFTFFNKIIEMSNVDKEYYKIILKVISIAYVVEFGSTTIEDMGLKSLANKVSFIGKLIILTISAPLIYAVFNILNELII